MCELMYSWSGGVCVCGGRDIVPIDLIGAPTPPRPTRSRGVAPLRDDNGGVRVKRFRDMLRQRRTMMIVKGCVV